MKKLLSIILLFSHFALFSMEEDLKDNSRKKEEEVISRFAGYYDLLNKQHKCFYEYYRVSELYEDNPNLSLDESVVMQYFKTSERPSDEHMKTLPSITPFVFMGIVSPEIPMEKKQEELDWFFHAFKGNNKERREMQRVIDQYNCLIVEPLKQRKRLQPFMLTTKVAAEEGKLPEIPLEITEKIMGEKILNEEDLKLKMPQ